LHTLSRWGRGEDGGGDAGAASRCGVDDEFAADSRAAVAHIRQSVACGRGIETAPGVRDRQRKHLLVSAGGDGGLGVRPAVLAVFCSASVQQQ
jgi:hypothetical protein